MEIHFPFSPLQHVAGERKQTHTRDKERLSTVSLRQTALLVPFPLWNKTKENSCCYQNVQLTFGEIFKTDKSISFLGCFKRSHKNKCKYLLYCPAESVLFPGFVLWYSHFREHEMLSGKWRLICGSTKVRLKDSLCAHLVYAKQANNMLCRS